VTRRWWVDWSTTLVTRSDVGTSGRRVRLSDPSNDDVVDSASAVAGNVVVWCDVIVWRHNRRTVTWLWSADQHFRCRASNFDVVIVSSRAAQQIKTAVKIITLLSLSTNIDLLSYSLVARNSGLLLIFRITVRNCGWTLSNSKQYITHRTSYEMVAYLKCVGKNYNNNTMQSFTRGAGGATPNKIIGEASSKSCSPISLKLRLQLKVTLQVVRLHITQKMLEKKPKL